MKKQFMGKWFSFALVLAMLISLMGNSGAQAAKAPKISKKSVNVTAGKSATVTIKNKPSGAKITWKTKNAKIATVKNGKIKGVKAGKTTVTAKVVYKKGKKKITKNFRVKVTVKAAKNAATQAPATQAPAASVPAPAAPTVAPSASTAPVVTPVDRKSVV